MTKLDTNINYDYYESDNKTGKTVCKYCLYRFPHQSDCVGFIQGSTYRQLGPGPTYYGPWIPGLLTILVFLHGYPDSAASWRYTMSALSKEGFHCLGWFSWNINPSDFLFDLDL